MTKQPPIAKADLQKTQGNRAPAAVNDKDVLCVINSPAMKAQLAAALPRHMTAERMIRIATTEIRKVPELRNCDSTSFIGAIVQCSQLGLEPGSALGHAYLLPFGNGKAKNGKKKRTADHRLSRHDRPCPSIRSNHQSVSSCCP